MSKRNKAKQTKVQSPDNGAGEAQEIAVIATPEEAHESFEILTGYEALVAKLSPELRAKAEEQLKKLLQTQERTEANKHWTGFDKAMQDAECGVGKFVEALANEHRVDLTGRRIVITFPDGKFHYTHGVKGTASESKGNGSGFTSHGKVELDGISYMSLHDLAGKMGWQYEGRRTAFQAVEEPQELGTKKPLDFKNSIERREDGVLVVTRIEASS